MESIFLRPKAYFVVLIFSIFSTFRFFNFWFFDLFLQFWVFPGFFLSTLRCNFSIIWFYRFFESFHFFTLIFLKNKNRNSTYVEKIDFQKIRNVKNRLEIGDLLKEKIDILKNDFRLFDFLNVRFFRIFDFYQQSAFVELIKKYRMQTKKSRSLEKVQLKKSIKLKKLTSRKKIWKNTIDNNQKDKMDFWIDFDLFL